jgi:hypothetical protein
VVWPMGWLNEIRITIVQFLLFSLPVIQWMTYGNLTFFAKLRIIAVVPECIIEENSDLLWIRPANL